MGFQALRLLFLVNIFMTWHVDYCHGRREWHDNFYDFTVKNIEGKRVRLEKYRGTPSLVVNVASDCGYTDRTYRDLVDLSKDPQFEDRLNILAFPCNQFGHQEPQSNEEIKHYVKALYDDKVEEWKLFCQLWENYRIITELHAKTKEYQRAVFLNTAGPEALRVFNSLTFNALADGTREDEYDITLIMKKLTDVIVGERNETYERYVFNKREQKETENIDTYVNNLREMVKSCNFGELQESLLRDRVVLGIRDHGTRRLLLQKRKLTLSQAIDICRSAEATASQLRELGEESRDSVHGVRPKPRRSDVRKKDVRKESHKRWETTIQCKYCGKKHRKMKEECPAYGKKCNKCQKMNHFACCCNTKSIRTVDYEESEYSETDSEVESVNCVEVVNATSSNSTKKPLYAEMMIDDNPVKFQIDSGATVNVIPKKYVKSKIDTRDAELRMYNETTLMAEGRVKIILRNPKNKKKYRVDFMVVKENNRVPLLGRNTSEKMKLIKVNYDTFKQIHSVKKKGESELLTEYEDVFDDARPGKLPGLVHLVTDQARDVRPTQCNAKPVPVSMKEKVKKGLNDLVQQDILAPVDEPTDWCSRLVVTEKKGTKELRYCIDPRPLNKVLQREIHRLPVMDDILPELSKAKVFSKLDLKSGYLHCELDKESSYLTTINTPFGRYRWKRLPFGLKVSSEIFQKKLQQALAGLEGVECVADDIIVFGVGSTDEEAEGSHDQRLRALLQRCRERGIKLNQKKSVLKAPSVTFLGHIVSAEGLKPDPLKIKAIIDLPNPTDATEVQRVQGSVQYLARFLPRLSETFEPIRKLTHKGVPWEWKAEQETAMKETKRLLTAAPILAFYDPEKELVIQCDASKSGLGSTLLQEGKPVAYASRALTETEQRYAQIEKEALAIVFSLERFHQYTFGRHVKVHSDHKPLETIVKKPLHRAPRRLQGMLMRMLHYDIEITWVKGKDMHIADLLSRAYLPETTGAGDFAEVNAVTGPSMNEDKIKELAEHTSKDENLQILKAVIMQGWPEEKSLVPEEAKPYYHVRDELSYQNGLLYRGERIVIPVTMRKKMREMLHDSHLGVESCLRRARECLHWPGMNADIKTFISTCDACRTYERQNQKETLQPTELPDRPWEKVGVDLFELKGKHYLITVDYFSNFWEIDRLHELDSRMVIKKLKGHFARYGIPNTIISDNGPQFASEAFVKFRKKWEFDHLTISPRHSQTNGKAEAAVKAAKQMIRKSEAAHTDPYKALLGIRNTPQQGIDSSPAQRLQGRRTRTTLPSTDHLLKPRGAEILKEEKRKMKAQQRKQSHHYNKNSKDLTTLQEGDTVRLKPYKLGDHVWQKAVVLTRLDERSYEIETELGQRFRRNRKDLKRTDELPHHQQSNPNPNPNPKPNTNTQAPQETMADKHSTTQTNTTRKTDRGHKKHKESEPKTNRDQQTTNKRPDTTQTTGDNTRKTRSDQLRQLLLNYENWGKSLEIVYMASGQNQEGQM
eukprot:XP_011662146.1 PREDICTED: uncharacterized protein K02A2.6-like [Strongylocentrotus purpuratus]